MGWFEKVQAKLELYRLEQRYTRREKRTTFISEAQYVDGEYVYGAPPMSPKSTGSTGNSTNSNSNSFGKRTSIMGSVRVRELGRARS